MKTKTIALILGGLAVATEAAAQNVQQQAYKSIKDIEKLFPAPLPFFVVNVGTFDARTGAFHGLRTPPWPWRSVGYGPHVAPRRSAGGAKSGSADRATWVDSSGTDASDVEPDVPEVVVNAIGVGLRFDIVNRGANDFQATANGLTTIVPPGQSSVTIDVGGAADVFWTLRSGRRVAASQLKINRSALLVHAGALTIPALPIGIVYEPPQDNGKRNQAGYSTRTSFGTAVSVSFGSESVTASPATTGFEDVNGFKSSVKQIASVVKGIASIGQDLAAATGADSDPTVKAASAAAGKISSGLSQVAGALDPLLGTASASQKVRETSDREHVLEVVDVAGVQTQTLVHEGPGIGDMISYLKNARFAYLASGGRLQLLPLGAETTARVPVKLLLSDLNAIASGSAPLGSEGVAVGPGTLLKKETLQALLSLDPFASGGPNAPLDASRFVRKESFQIGGSHETYTWTHTVNTTDRTSSTKVTTFVEDCDKGLLSFLGLGVTQNVHINSTTTQSSSREQREGQEQSVAADFYADALETYVIEAYYDRVFGTFGFVRVPLAQEAVAGTLYDGKNRPIAGQLVTLAVAGRQHVVRTDAQGHYSFRAPTIAPGQGTLFAQGLAPRPVQITKAQSIRQDMRP